MKTTNEDTSHDTINNNSQNTSQLRESMHEYSHRAISPALEEILYKPFNVLDHGFIRVIDYMGNDNSIVQAARVSYGHGTKKINQDKALINYLMRHEHTTPFEMCEIKLHVKLPIFIARQWIRHRTANVNEYSARYSVLENEFYIPQPKDITCQSQSNKQARTNQQLNNHQIEQILEILKNHSVESYNKYTELLKQHDTSTQNALAREIARIVLPVNFYTQWYWKIDLHNLLHFLKLRASPHAQFEIQQYANIILNIVKMWVPFTYDAFMNYSFNSKSLSQEAIASIKQTFIKHNIKEDEIQHSMSDGEWQEYSELFFKKNT